MKQFITFIFSILLSLNFAFAQEEGKKEVKYTNPFEQAGIKNVKIATLSQGKYQEFHDLDSIVQIGTTLINVNTRQIVGYVEQDTANAMPSPTAISRWMSPDPLAEHTYSLSPYNFGYNNPVYWNDPDGRCPICPFLAKGGAAMATDVLMQTIMSYAFDDNVNSWGEAFGNVDWREAGISGAQGMIPWSAPGGKWGKAAITAMSDVAINAGLAQMDGRDYTMEDAARDFLVGFAAQGSSEIADKLMSSKKLQGLLGKNTDIEVSIGIKSHQISDYAKSNQIFSAQKSLRDTETVDNYFSQMKAGKFDASKGAAGFIHKGKTLLTDGNHRMNAAIKYAIETGDNTYVQQLIRNGNFTHADPSSYGYKFHSLPTK